MFVILYSVILDIVLFPLFISRIGRGNGRSLSAFCRASLGTEALSSMFGPLGE